MLNILRSKVREPCIKLSVNLIKIRVHSGNLLSQFFWYFNKMAVADFKSYSILRIFMYFLFLLLYKHMVLQISSFIYEENKLRFWKIPMNIQDWFPLGLMGLTSLQSRGLSKVFSKTTVQKHQFFSTIYFFFCFYCLGRQTQKILLQFMSKSVLPTF